jgi:hypothetical protein
VPRRRGALVRVVVPLWGMLASVPGGPWYVDAVVWQAEVVVAVASGSLPRFIRVSEAPRGLRPTSDSRWPFALG